MKLLTVLFSLFIFTASANYPADKWNIAWIRTGQTASYWTHDDAWQVTNRKIGIPRNFEITDGGLTVTDHVTGLVWVRNPAQFGKATYAAQKAKCDNLTFAGKSDWRMPDPREIMTIRDWSNWNPSCVSLFILPSAYYEYYFCKMTMLNFPDSYIYADLSTFDIVTATGRSTAMQKVLPVRGGKTYTPFAVAVIGNGVIEDRASGLMWTQNDQGKISINDAATSASRCRIGGFSDWRVPNINELASIMQFDGNDPVLPEFFNVPYCYGPYNVSRRIQTSTTGKWLQYPFSSAIYCNLLGIERHDIGTTESTLYVRNIQPSFKAAARSWQGYK